MVLPRQAAVIGSAIAGLVWPEEPHLFMTEPNERLGGEAPVELPRRGEAGRVVDLLLSAGLGIPRFRLLQ